MSPSVSFTPPSSSVNPDDLQKKSEKIENLQENTKFPFAPAIKYFFAAKLNGFTGEKFKCLRNWEKRSGNALLQAVNDAFSPDINNSLLSGTTEISGFIQNLKSKPPVEGCNDGSQQAKDTGVLRQTLLKKCGLDQSLETCEQFVNVACNFLSQVGEDGKPQTVNRLLTITGILCAENVDIRAIAENIVRSLSDNFFENRLQKILQNKCGKFAGPAEKLVTVLNIKGLTDRFLKKFILENPKFSAEKIKENGNIYEKLILKGVSTFIEVKGSEGLKLDALLNDKKLDKILIGQLKKLKEAYNGDTLIKGSLKTEKVFVSEFLRKLKNEDVGPLTIELLDALKKEENTEIKEKNTERIDAIISKSIPRAVSFWDEFSKESGQVLLQAVNDNFSPVVNKLLTEIRDYASEKLSSLKVSAETDPKKADSENVLPNWGKEVVGLDHLSNVCEQFLTVGCDLLMQSGETKDGVTPQTINRLLTVAGVLYSGNEDVRAIVKNVSDTFFAEKLPEILNKNGAIDTPLSFKECTAVLLGKHVVDNCLAALKGPKFSAEEIKNNGDAYEKLILKGVSAFVDIKGSDELDLDTILKDENLAPKIKTQIKALKDSYSESRLLQVGQLAVGSEKIFIQTFLSKIKDKDITRLFEKSEDNKDSLKGILIDTAKDCLWAQVQPVVSVTESGLISLGKAFVSGVEIAYVGISKLWDAFWGSNDNKVGAQNPVSEAQREVKTEERIVPKYFETLKKEKALEDDFGEYLIELFNEDQNVEQKAEESTGIGTILWNIGSAAWEGTKVAVGLVGCGLNWVLGTSPQGEGEKRTVREGQAPEHELKTTGQLGGQPEPQSNDVLGKINTETLETGMAQASGDTPQLVAQPQVSSDQQVLEGKAVDGVIVERQELEADAESNVISDDVKAGVSVVDQSNSKLDSNVAQQTASQMDPKSSVIQSGATVITTEMNQKTDSESRTEPQGNVAQEIDEGDGMVDKMARGVGTVIGTGLRWGIDGLRWLSRTGDQPALEPQEASSGEQDSDTSKAGVVQKVEGVSQSVAQPQVREVEERNAEVEDDAESDMTLDDDKAKVPVGSQSMSMSNPNVVQQTDPQKNPNPGIVSSDAVETKQETDSMSENGNPIPTVSKNVSGEDGNRTEQKASLPSNSSDVAGFPQNHRSDDVNGGEGASPEMDDQEEGGAKVSANKDTHVEGGSAKASKADSAQQGETEKKKQTWGEWIWSFFGGE